jgi:hypothetical protein
MSAAAAIHIVGPAEFDPGTTQTPSSKRREAIAPAPGIASAIWQAFSSANRTPPETGAVSMGRRSQHRQANRRQLSQRHLAVSSMSFQTAG